MAGCCMSNIAPSAFKPLIGLSICPGLPDHNFVEMLLSKKGKIMSRDGKDVVASIDSSAPVHLNGDAFTQTVRRFTCEILTNDVKCGQCIKYRDTLHKSFHRWKKTEGHTVSKTIELLEGE